MRRRGMTLLMLAALTLVASCGHGPESEPTSAPSTTSAASTPTEPSSEPTSDPPSAAEAIEATDGVPPFPTGTDPEFDKGSGEWDLVLTGVRVGQHEGYDRIVVEFKGTGRPGWSLSYIEETRLEGSGRTVSLDGEAFLGIFASHTTWPDPDYYDGPARLEPADGGRLEEVFVAGTFEGYTQVIVGIDGDTSPYRVFTLGEPSRLVIDVRH